VPPPSVPPPVPPELSSTASQSRLTKPSPAVAVKFSGSGASNCSGVAEASLE